MKNVAKKVGKKTTIRLQEHYAKNIYDYEKIGKITLDKINIPETSTNDRNFPGVKQKTKFAMVLNSEVDIQLDACYEFRLSSDDGSILWIDDQLIVDNDGGHQMKMEKDSIVLTKGKHKVKLWYFQGMPDRFGLILNSKIIGKPKICPSGKTVPLVEKMVEFSLSSQILFETKKYELKPAAIIEINKIAQNIMQSAPSTITVIGHTDNVGGFKFNQLLSLKRAQAVAKQLEITIDKTEIRVIPIGKGDTTPIADNSTTMGKTKNRRVEILFNK